MPSAAKTAQKMFTKAHSLVCRATGGRVAGRVFKSPVLLIGGGKNHAVPPSLAKEAATRQSKACSATECKEYPARSYYTLGQDGWGEGRRLRY
jgi:hypothetical protein